MLLREVAGAVIGIVAGFCFQDETLLRSHIIMKLKMKTATATFFSFFLPVSFTVPKCPTHIYTTHSHTSHTHTLLNISFPHYETFLTISIQRHLLNEDTWTQLKETGNSAN